MMATVTPFVICECSCEVAQLGKGFAHRVRSCTKKLKSLAWTCVASRKKAVNCQVAHGLGGVHEQQGHEIGAVLAQL